MAPPEGKCGNVCLPNSTCSALAADPTVMFDFACKTHACAYLENEQEIRLGQGLYAFQKKTAAILFSASS